MLQSERGTLAACLFERLEGAAPRRGALQPIDAHELAHFISRADATSRVVRARLDRVKLLFC
jgi:hypothetical protein